MKIIPQVQILADPLYYQLRRFTIELVPLLDPYGYCGTSLKIKKYIRILRNQQQFSIY